MSRGVRDLRDLICVSRLAYSEGDEEEIFSDDDRKTNKEFTLLSVSSEHMTSESNSHRCLSPISQVVTPDSGFITNDSPGLCFADAENVSDDGLKNGNTIQQTNVKVNSLGKSPSGNSEIRKKKKVNQSLHTSIHELPRPLALPPVQQINEIATDQSQVGLMCGLLQTSQPDRLKTRINFDDILPFMDATLIANWLTRSNLALQELTKYCSKGANFVQFAHFWLSEFPDLQKKEILSMEYDILLDEISLAFAVGRENRKVVRRDILDICGAVFKEYPVKLLGANGRFTFLDYLDILSSEKQEQFKQLLSDVHCSTTNRMYAQWLLATRSFAVVNVWSSVVNFYRNLIGEGQAHGMPVLDLCSSKESVPHRRMLQAIRLGYIDVINYLISAGHVSPAYSDSHGRSLLFSAVMHNQTEVIRYLMAQNPPVIAINQPADTGNTALHAASNSGNLAVVELLCKFEGIDVNCVNQQCENATPLHLAVMHGHVKVVECLLKHGADPTCKMGDTSVRDLAMDFDHKEILALLVI